MKLPNVPTIGRDEKRNVTYIVMAYRKLTPGEWRLAVRNAAKKKPDRTRTVRIVSLLGLEL